MTKVSLCTKIFLMILILILSGCSTTTKMIPYSQDNALNSDNHKKVINLNDEKKETAKSSERIEEEEEEEEEVANQTQEDNINGKNNEAQTQQNYWTPQPKTTWQWQLDGNLDTSYDVKVYDIDLFDNDKSTIQELQSQGKKVICYFSAGSFESWRDDANYFPEKILVKKMDDWDERWLDISHIDYKESYKSSIREIMTSRIELAKEKGCDAIEPDNVDAYDNNVVNFNENKITKYQQLEYLRFLSETSHKNNLSIGLKNAVALIEEYGEELSTIFDWALNEQCHQYNECEPYIIFTDKNKAVFNTEYNTNNKEEKCQSSYRLGISTIFKNLDLTPHVEFCS